MKIKPSLFRTPLYDAHLCLGARMVDFGGWEMPVQYDSIISEYFACRRQCAIFDICHMGEFIVQGDPRHNGLDRVVTCSLASLKLHHARYGLMLNDKGGVIDDLIIFCLSHDKYLLVVNAANIQKDFSHINQHLISGSVINDISMITGKLDIQGPMSRTILMSVFPGIDKLDYFHFDSFDFNGASLLISRTGYTGELGYEIFVPWEQTKILWHKLLENDKVKPAGLGARDILRIEMGYSLYGHEINEAMCPLDAGLSRFIDLNKDFIGKQALVQRRQQDVLYQKICFVSETRKSPRHGQHIYGQDHQLVGHVTSGAFSPSLEKGIGLALVKGSQDWLDQKIFFGDDKQQHLAWVKPEPLYRNGSLKK